MAQEITQLKYLIHNLATGMDKAIADIPDAMAQLRQCAILSQALLDNTDLLLRWFPMQCYN